METVRKFKHLNSVVDHNWSYEIPPVRVSLSAVDEDGTVYMIRAYFGHDLRNEVILSMYEDGVWSTNFSSSVRNAEDSEEILLNLRQAVDFAKVFSDPSSWSIFDVG